MIRLLVLVALWGAVALLSLSYGAVPLTVKEVGAVLLSHLPFASRLPLLAGALEVAAGLPEAYGVILLQVRLPRVVLAGLVGASLSLSGAALQGLFRNPMASPSVLGVSSGAALGAASAIAWNLGGVLGGVELTPAAAFAGALVTTLLVYQLARWGGGVSTTRLLLAGVALGSFLSALVSLLIVFNQRRLSAVVFWLMGSFADADWTRVLLVIPYFLVGLGAAFVYARELNALLLGEEGALHLGVDVPRVQGRLLLATSLLTGAAVSVSGVIGFVGLIVPHGVRLFTGADHRLLVPASALAGALFLTVTDTFARTVAAPTEIPVGAITALLGGPFFLFLLRRQGGGSLT